MKSRANEHIITVPLYALIRDPGLRRIFWQAGRDLGDEFAVPVTPQPELTGGAVNALELVEG